ncbi:putative atrial natriuretic peptide receptor [Operophtera brumata]|uniref:Putative atrial natriuretic peptide receptor n=1 Tax=Operophtera brumata TaxID=104452 RepID=A0A0L7LFI8_OPEBR|nr:putative atrial natriuretic peptide receptor [Operophtera brumata]
MDNAGDAEGNFTVIGLVADTSASGGWSAQPVATFRYANSSVLLPELVGASNIAWIGGTPPAAEPACGFDGVRCSLPHDPGALSAAAAVAAAAILAAALLLRHYRYEQKLASVLWRIEAKDLKFIPSNDKASLQPTCRNIRELRHENLTALVGVCVESGASCIVSAYCSRGSLARVLADRDLHLDDMFVASLVADLLRGLTPPARGSQRGDVYSFSIILYEILGRNGPWGETTLSNTGKFDYVIISHMIIRYIS